MRIIGRVTFRQLAVMGVIASFTPAFAGYNYSSWGSGSWGASDATLGVSGYAIEDFEDVNLVNGLKVGVTSNNGNLAPTSTLPNTFTPSDDTYGNAFTLGGGGAWDGTHGVVNTRTNQTFSYSDSGSWGLLTFYFVGGATSAGFSIQQVDRSANVLINGVNQGSLFSLGASLTGPNARQGYLRIDAFGGDMINSVAIQDAFGFGDGYMFDHVAFTPVPEPSTLAVFGIALLALNRRRK